MREVRFDRHESGSRLLIGKHDLHTSIANQVCLRGCENHEAVLSGFLGEIQQGKKRVVIEFVARYVQQQPAW